MRGWARRFGIGLVVLTGILVAATLLTARPADPALWPPREGAASVQVFVVSNGYHTGLALPRAALADLASEKGHAALSAVTQRFGTYEWLELGWGDREFYQSVPTIGHLTPSLALRALFLPGNKSVLHVVGLGVEPPRAFASGEVVPVRLSAEGFARLAAKLDASFAPSETGALAEIGRGLYGPSLFYPANGTFSIFKVCNHWIGDMLSAAGVPVTPVLDTFASGLILDLRLRADARAALKDNRPR
jgi:uncharacterized protein (TIGR02117 family)